MFLFMTLLLLTTLVCFENSPRTPTASRQFIAFIYTFVHSIIIYNQTEGSSLIIAK